MEIGSIAAAEPSQTPSAVDTTLGNDVFMTLLVAQLKAQNPLEPLDPEQFVSQLVQFNTLNEIIQIREAVEVNPEPVNPAGDEADAAPALPE